MECYCPDRRDVDSRGVISKKKDIDASSAATKEKSNLCIQIHK